jgi:hypothetical protein
MGNILSEFNTVLYSCSSYTLTHTAVSFPLLTQLFFKMRCLLSVFFALTNILLFHTGQYTSNWRIESHITFVIMALYLYCSEVLRIRTWKAKNRNNCSKWYSLLQAGIWKSAHAWCTQQIVTLTEYFFLHAVQLETVIVNVTNRWEAIVLVAVGTSEVLLEVGFVSNFEGNSEWM